MPLSLEEQIVFIKEEHIDGVKYSKKFRIFSKKNFGKEYLLDQYCVVALMKKLSKLEACTINPTVATQLIIS